MYLHVTIKRPSLWISYPCGREYDLATLVGTIVKVIRDSHPEVVAFTFTVTREEVDEVGVLRTVHG